MTEPTPSIDPVPASTGATLGAVVLGILAVMCLLSTSCFGICAIGMGSDHELPGLGTFLGICAAVMGAITVSLFLWLRAVLRRNQPSIPANLGGESKNPDLDER